MVVELKKGYTIESKYDKFTDSYITRLLDNESKQVGRALYSPDIVGRNYDLQSIKDHFASYINNKTVDETETFEEPEEELTDLDLDLDLDLDSEEPIEESLDAEVKKKARKTKKATRKAKLPALSKLSPIMPDQAKGIAKFNSMQADGNSSMGSTTGSTSLGEEWLDRQTLINRLSDMGFRYNWEKYSDKSLYRIYHERQDYLNKWRKEKRERDRIKKNAKLLADQKKENSKDSYFRDGIEFESEDAAREYFGESMSRPYHWNVDEIERIILKAWEDAGLRLRRDRIHISRHDNWCFVEIEYIDDWTFKHINKAWIKKTLKKELGLSEIKQSSWKNDGWGNSDYGKTLRYDMYVSDEQGLNEAMGNSIWYDPQTFDDIIEILKQEGVREATINWGTWNYSDPEQYYSLRDLKKRLDVLMQQYTLSSHKEAPKLNIVMQKHEDGVITVQVDVWLSSYVQKHDILKEFRIIAKSRLNESMDNKFYLNDMHKAWDMIDPEDEVSIPTTRSKLNESFGLFGDKSTFGSQFEKYIPNKMRYKEYDFVQDRYRDILYWVTQDGFNDDDIADFQEALSEYTDLDGAFIIRRDDSVYNYEKDKNSNKGVFVKNLYDDEDDFLTEARKPKFANSRFAEKVKQDMKSGKLTYQNIKEWDKEQNGGVEPNPPFNTRELMNYFKDTMNESHGFKTITEGLKFFEHKHFDETCEDLELETMFEALKSKKKLTGDDIKKLGDFMNRAKSSDEVATYVKGLLSESTDNIVNESFSISELTDKAEKLLAAASNEGVWNTDLYDVDVLGTLARISILVKGDWKHDHARFDLIAREFFPDAEMYEYELDEDDDYESDYYPSVHVIELGTRLGTNYSDESPLQLELMNEAIDIDSEAVGHRVVSKFEDECRVQGLQVAIESSEINSEGYFEVVGSISQGQEARPDEILDLLVNIFAQYGYDVDAYCDWKDNEVTFDVTTSERVA